MWVVKGSTFSKAKLGTSFLEKDWKLCLKTYFYRVIIYNNNLLFNLYSSSQSGKGFLPTLNGVMTASKYSSCDLGRVVENTIFIFFPDVTYSCLPGSLPQIPEGPKSIIYIKRLRRCYKIISGFAYEILGKRRCKMKLNDMNINTEFTKLS